MASTVSFDVVSEYDQQELVNALDQVRREVATRYDFKGSKVEITLDEKSVTVVTDSEMRSAAVQDLIGSKPVRRGLSLKVFDWGEIEPAGGMTFKQVAGLQQIQSHVRGLLGVGFIHIGRKRRHVAGLAGRVLAVGRFGDERMTAGTFRRFLLFLVTTDAAGRRGHAVHGLGQLHIAALFFTRIGVAARAGLQAGVVADLAAVVIALVGTVIERNGVHGRWPLTVGLDFLTRLD